MIARIVVLCLAATALFAADISGRWSGTVKMSLDGNDIEMPHEIVLRQEGDSITGTAGPGPEQQWAISKARIQGSELTFEVRAPDGPVFEYRLAVSGSEMSGDYKMTIEGQVSAAKLMVRKR